MYVCTKVEGKGLFWKVLVGLMLATADALTDLCTMQIQLSTYGDSLGGDLKALKGFIDRNLQGAPH